MLLCFMFLVFIVLIAATCWAEMREETKINQHARMAARHGVALRRVRPRDRR
jgi:hypothetical protein